MLLGDTYFDVLTSILKHLNYLVIILIVVLFAIVKIF